jgi:hypothetical protein
MHGLANLENTEYLLLQFIQMSSNGFAELSNLPSVDRSSLSIYIITSFNVGSFAFLAQVFAPINLRPDMFLRGFCSRMLVICIFSLHVYLCFHNSKMTIFTCRRPYFSSQLHAILSDRPRPTALLPPRSYGKPEAAAAAAVDRLLMMDIKMPETC